MTVSLSEIEPVTGFAPDCPNGDWAATRRGRLESGDFGGRRALPALEYEIAVAGESGCLAVASCVDCTYGPLRFRAEATEATQR